MAAGSMKALVIPGKLQPLELQEKPVPRAGQGEAIVRVHAAALNHRDIWIQKGQYAGLKYPIVPGSDGAGVVTEMGEPGPQQEIGREWIGREVIINPAMGWGDSPTHQHPVSFHILGLPEDGTLAEYVKVPAANLVAKPTHLTFEEAAALPLAGATAFRAIFSRAQLKPGEKVLITGIGGGVALFAFQFALATGATVYTTSGKDEKLERSLSLGAKGGANYTKENWAANLKDQAGGFDVIIDGAAGDGIDTLLDLAAPGGRLALYGATRGNPSLLQARRIFWKQLSILGSTMASPSDFKEMENFVQKHGIRPVVDQVFPLEQGETAFRRMDNADQFGKIVLKVL